MEVAEEAPLEAAVPVAEDKFLIYKKASNRKEKNMTQILVNTKALPTLKNKLDKSVQACNECINSISGVRRDLDWDIKAGNNIDEQLNSLYQKLINEQEKLEEYAEALNKVNSLFLSKDNELKREMGQLADGFSLEDGNAIGGGIGAVTTVGGIAGAVFNNKQIIDMLKGVINSPFVKGMGLTGLALSSEQVREILKQYKNASSFLKESGDVIKVLEESWPNLGALIDNPLLDTIGYVNDAEKLVKAIETVDEKAFMELGEKYAKKVGKACAKAAGKEGLVATEIVYASWNFVDHAKNINDFIGPKSGNSFGVGMAKYALDVVEGTAVETQFDIAHDVLSPVYKLFGSDIDKVYMETVGATGYEGVKKGIKEIADSISFMATEGGSDLRNYIFKDLTSKFKNIFS